MGSINSNSKYYRSLFSKCNFTALKLLTNGNSADIINYRKSCMCASVFDTPKISFRIRTYSDYILALSDLKSVRD